MQEPSSSSINHAIKNMDLAFKSFFRGGGYPNFKKKVGPQSFGKNVIKIDRFYASSKTCSTCGHKVDKLPLSTREWTCAGCGAIHDRDINAAINIRNSGLDRPGATAERPAIKGRNEAVISLKN